ncbi:MAG: hypothetical protein JST26_08595 [Bacteroidetes bacterium]|nr:hypothetical protein [Bacteroidota bacterium]
MFSFRASKSIFLLLCFFAALSLPSQTAGYLGKRFITGYGFYTSPSVINTNGQGQRMTEKMKIAYSGHFALNYIHELYGEMAWRRRLVIGVSARYYKTSFSQELEIRYAQDAGSSSTFNYLSSTTHGTYYIRGMNYSVYLKLYSTRYLSPWGRYFLIGPVFKTHTATYSPDRLGLTAVYKPIPQGPAPDFGATTQRGISFDVMAGFGRNRILYDRLSVDYGYNCHLFGLFSPLKDFLFTNLTDKNYIAVTSRRRSYSANRFNFFIKIGYLF